MSVRTRFQAAAERHIAAIESGEPARPTVREPLTTNQHILHLLLTVFTLGLWAPVWVVRAIQGNRGPA